MLIQIEENILAQKVEQVKLCELCCGPKGRRIKEEVLNFICVHWDQCDKKPKRFREQVKEERLLREQIRRCQKKFRLTDHDIAKIVGYSVDYYRIMMSGKRALSKRLRAYAQRLGDNNE